MLIPPKYKLTKSIVSLLQDIERLKTQLDLLPRDKILEKYSRQKSILKSALFSARIEGNPHHLSEISLDNIKNSRQKTKIELQNICKAVEFILQKSWQNNLTIQDLKNLHQLVLSNLSDLAGSLRQEPSAIYNQAGVAVYVCPMPNQIKILLTKWLDFINKKNESFVPIKVALVHFSFEKIHPFLDGNGRVGRLLAHLIFKKYHYDLRGLVAFEEYLDNHRQTYYELLSLNDKNITDFIDFFLTGLKDSLEKAVEEKSKSGKINKEDLLPPRRLEILQIIKDHRQISFDFIKRRFMAVNDRLLRYDLKKLQDSGFIKKRGVTRGAVYEVA